MSIPTAPVKLWSHPNPTATQMWAFKQLVAKKYGITLDDYNDLFEWSTNNIAEFWREIWEFTGKPHRSTPLGKVLEPNVPMFPRPDFFKGTKLNFATSLLYPTFPASPEYVVDAETPAIRSITESTQTVVTFGELRFRVSELSNALRVAGLKPLDRVAGFIGNHADAVVAMLATTSLGAIWTGVSPDTGVAAVLDRLEQISPKVLFADNAVEYNGKIHQSRTKVASIIEGLKHKGLQLVVVFETIKGLPDSLNFDDLNKALVNGGPQENGKLHANGTKLNGFKMNGHTEHPPVSIKSYHDLVAELPKEKGALSGYELFPASHPVYILYSSGTTGKPKCIVHSAAGTLIQHKKEHMLHCDIRPKDSLLYFTTTTWMMWHWLVSALASGATIILYDGSPFYPHGNLTMPKLISDLQITHFGTSAKYLSILEQHSVFPEKENIDLSCLKAIYSTGSPLAPSTFKYVYSAFPSHINLGSITGGTDIISLFGAPCPLVPVYQGEIQCKGLGMAVCAVDPDGQIITGDEPGDLVCNKPFPSQPVDFWGPDGQSKYQSSYFEVSPYEWRHGDFVHFNPKTGGMVMLGRSDGVLKPAGVRFGSAEIYNVLLKHFATEVEDALCIGRRRQGDADEIVVLFLKMEKGHEFTAELVERIKKVVRVELSARHVPGIVDQCEEIPVTTNGKKVEVAVKQILCGMNVKTSASVANAACLDWYREWTRKTAEAGI